MTAQAYNVNDPVYGNTSVGAYQITIAYVDGDSGRPVDTTLNGGTPIAVNFPGTNDNNWNTPGGPRSP